MVTEVIYMGDHVGTAVWDAQRQRSAFEFTPEFVDKGIDLAPLTMPLADLKRGERIYTFPALERNTFYGLPGLLADALPDKFGNAIIAAWQRRTGHNNLDPVERLSYIGRRAMGALEFRPATGPGRDSADPINIEDLVELANAIVNAREALQVDLLKKPKDSLMDIIKVGTSAGGARAKAVIAYNEKSGEVRSGQLDAPADFTHWLLKFDGVETGALGDSKGFGKIEFAYYNMAVEAGIEMSECRLLKENDRAHFMTRRFDRPEAGGKIHVQTLCGLAHMDFNLQGTHSYEDVFEVMRMLQLPYADAEQMFRRMVFNVLGRNLDDHTKNTAFMMDDKGRWSLAPAYDLSYCYNPDGWTSKHQMSVNRKFENITDADLMAVARSINIRRPKEHIDAVKSALLNWDRFAEDANVSELQVEVIKRELKLRMNE